MVNQKGNQVIYCTAEEKEYLKTELEKYRLTKRAEQLGLSVSATNGVQKRVPLSEQDNALLSTLTWLLYYYEHEIRNDVSNGITTGEAFQAAATKDNAYTDGYESYLNEIKQRIAKLTGEFELGDYPQGIKDDTEETKEVEPEPEPIESKKPMENPFSKLKRLKKNAPAEGRS